MIYRTTVGAADILRAGARCRRPPVGIPRVGAQTGWPEVVGKNLQRDGRKEGGGRRKGGRNREEGGRRKEGGKKEGLSCGPWGPGGFLGSSRAVPRWSRVVLWGSRGAPWGPLGAVWEFLGSPQGILGCLLGFGGARGAKTDDSEDLFLGLLAVFLGAISMYKGWSFFKKKGSREQKVGKV